jgi:DNA-binding IclR family transcriptional regulator
MQMERHTDLAPFEETAMKEDRQFVTALSRGLDVLRCFSPNRQVLSATEIALRIRLPQPTVWRLCHTLVETGYLVPVPGGKLRIGAPVLNLGYAALASLDYLQVIRPHMQQLAERFGASVVLAERHRSKMIYLEKCQGEALLIMNLPVGARLSLHDTATGWAYLAALTPERRAAALERLQIAFADDWPFHQANIDREAERYARDGFVLNLNTPHHKVITVAAVPIAGADGRPALALNCSVLNAMFSERQVIEEVAPALLEVAQMLEAQIVMASRNKPKKKPEGAAS